MSDNTGDDPDFPALGAPKGSMAEFHSQLPKRYANIHATSGSASSSSAHFNQSNNNKNNKNNKNNNNNNNKGQSFSYSDTFLGSSTETSASSPAEPASTHVNNASRNSSNSPRPQQQQRQQQRQGGGSLSVMGAGAHTTTSSSSSSSSSSTAPLSPTSGSSGPSVAIGDDAFSRLCWVYHTIDPAIIQDILHAVVQENSVRMIDEEVGGEEVDDGGDWQTYSSSSSSSSAKPSSAVSSSSASAAIAQATAKTSPTIPMKLHRDAVEAIVAAHLYTTFEDECVRAHQFQANGEARNAHIAAALDAGDIDTAIDLTLKAVARAKAVAQGDIDAATAAAIAAAEEADAEEERMRRSKKQQQQQQQQQGRASSDNSSVELGFRFRTARDGYGSSSSTGCDASMLLSANDAINKSKMAALAAMPSSTSSVTSSSSPSALLYSADAVALCRSIKCICRIGGTMSNLFGEGGNNNSSTGDTKHSTDCWQQCYTCARERVTHLQLRRAALFDKAQEIRRQSGVGKAKNLFFAASGVYAEQAHAITTQMEAANQVASLALFYIQNPGLVVVLPDAGVGGRGGSGGGGAGGAPARVRSSSSSTSSSSVSSSVPTPTEVSSPAVMVKLSGGSSNSSSSSSSSSSTAQIDLHGQHAAEAVALLRDHIFPQAVDEQVSTLHIVTGKGRHSHTSSNNNNGSHHSRVKNAVEALLKQMKGSSVEGYTRVGVLRTFESLESGGGFVVRFV